MASIHFAQPQPSDPIMRRKQKINKKRDNTQVLTWKPKCGKNHGSPQTAEYTMGEEYNNDLLSSSSPHVAVTVEATTSHSLSPTLSLTRCLCTHALYNYLQKCSTTYYTT